MGGLSPLCPQPRGDLVLRSPARSSRGKPQPCESCPEQQSPYACKRVIFLFCRQLVWTHYQAICLIFCLPAVVLAPSTRILPLQRVPWHTAQS